MTGRRSHGRLSALNGVVHQGSAELLFEIFSQRYEQASTLVTSNLPFNEWTEIFGSERLTGARLDRLTHHVHILELNGESYRLEHSKKARHPGVLTSPPHCRVRESPVLRPRVFLDT